MRIPAIISFMLALTILLLGCGGSGGSGSPGSPPSGSSGSTSKVPPAPRSPTPVFGMYSGIPDLGIGANMHGYRPLPADNPWNTPIDTDPVDPNSANLIASIGLGTSLHPDFGANWDGGPFGIPYMVVDHKTAGVAMSFDYSSQSDPGPYPFPANAPIEGGSGSTGDRHVLVIDRDAKKLYETWDSHPQTDGSWHCGSGAVFDLTSNGLRPLYWTSADAAGLPIFPGLVRYDEVQSGGIHHALRFTVSNTRHAFTSPARHWASSNTGVNVPPMGMRVRLKASFNMASYPADVRVILTALKKYGMFVADNGSNWYLSGAPDARWSDDNLNLLKQLKGSDFEVVKMGAIVSN